MINSHDDFETSPPVILENTSEKGIDTDPKLMFVKKQTIRPIVKTINGTV